MASDDLGERMKTWYEDRARFYLPRRTNTILRVDGKAFHTLTKNCERPFDAVFAALMNEVAKTLCEEIQGAKLGFVQSDEVSVLLTDYDSIGTAAWFDGNVQKMTSVAAGIATKAFNSGAARLAYEVLKEKKDGQIGFGTFDARVFTIPDPEEVVNYFIWRQWDATRNSILMAAQSMFERQAMHGQNCNKLQEMMYQRKNINWSTYYPTGFKRGRTVVRVTGKKDVEWLDKRTGEKKVQKDVERSWWEVDHEVPVFTKDRDYVLGRLPGAKQKDIVVTADFDGEGP